MPLEPKTYLRIAALRLGHGLSQHALGLAVKIDQSTIASYEAGHYIHDANARKIERHFNAERGSLSDKVNLKAQRVAQ